MATVAAVTARTMFVSSALMTSLFAEPDIVMLLSVELLFASVSGESRERQLSLDSNLFKTSVHDERSEVTSTVLFVVAFPKWPF